MELLKNITSPLKEQFSNEEMAVKYFAEKRWGKNPRCVKCKSKNVYVSKNITSKQPYKCASCGLRFTVKTGTIMEGSPVKVKIWLLAMYILSISKESISSILFAQWLEVTQKTAWYMAHRIREACNKD